MSDQIEVIAQAQSRNIRVEDPPVDADNLSVPKVPRGK
jgi:hypothetical protein